MARRVVMQATCDVCGVIGDDNDTENIRIVNNNGEWEIDMCQVCRLKFDEFVGSSREVPRSERLVRQTKARKSSSEPYLPKVATDVAADRPRTFHCDQEGCDYKGVDNRAIGVHKAKVHGIKGATKK